MISLIFIVVVIAQLLRMAAEDQGHVTWLRDTLLARGGALPTRVCPR
jgi:hypothetical protein